MSAVNTVRALLLGAAPAAAGPGSRWPQLLGAQYTFVEQWQSELASPYRGKLSLDPAGDQQPTHTIGFYTGWAPLDWSQLYFDVEKFMGAGGTRRGSDRGSRAGAAPGAQGRLADAVG